MTRSSDNSMKDDPNIYPDLIECLVFLGKYYNRPTSKIAITTGIPLLKGHLTPDLFLRAASKLHLNAYLKELELKELKEVGGPCVILLKDQKAGVLLSLHKTQAEVYIPTEDKDPQVISLKV